MIKYSESTIFKNITAAFLTEEMLSGFPAEVGIAMSAFESGWWKKPTGDFNYFGMTRGSWVRERCKMVPTSEFISWNQLQNFAEDERKTAQCRDGAVTAMANPDKKYWWSMRRWFRNYISLTAAVRDYVQNIINNPQLKPAWDAYQVLPGTRKSKEKLIRDLSRLGYSTGYAADQEIIIMGQSNVREAIELAVASMGVKRQTNV